MYDIDHFQSILVKQLFLNKQEQILVQLDWLKILWQFK